MTKTYDLMTLPPTAWVRFSEIKTSLPISAGGWANGIKAGKFPPPILPAKMGETAYWRAGDVQRLLLTGDWREKATA